MTYRQRGGNSAGSFIGAAQWVVGMCLLGHAGAVRVPVKILLRGLELQGQAELQQCHTCSVKRSALLRHALPVASVPGKSVVHAKLLAEDEAGMLTRKCARHI